MTDHRIIYCVVLSLAAVSVLGIGGTLVLSGLGKAVPSEVNSYTSMAVGALAAILARTSAQKKEE